MGIKNNEEKNEVLITLKKDFYDLGAIKETAEDFKKICSFELNENKKEVKVLLKLNDKRYSERLGHEFSNYVLGLMKNKLIV